MLTCVIIVWEAPSMFNAINKSVCVLTLMSMLYCGSAYAKDVEQKTHKFGQQIFVGKCAVSSDEEVGFLLGAGISLLADFTFKYIDKKVDDYKKGLNSQTFFSGSRSVGFKEVFSDNDQCITLVVGNFGKRFSKFEGTNGTLNANALAANFKLADYPHLLIELKAKNTVNNITLEPSYIFYNKQLSKSKGRGTKSTSLVVAISTKTISGQEDLEKSKAPLAVFRLNLGELKIGSEYNEIMNPGILRGAGSSVNLKKISDLSAAPNIYAVFTESENPSTAMSALMEAYTGDKSDIQKSLEEIVTKAVEKKKK